MHVQQYFFHSNNGCQIEKISTLIKMYQIKIYTIESICIFAFNLYENVIEKKEASSILEEEKIHSSWCLLVSFFFFILFLSKSYFFQQKLFLLLFSYQYCIGEKWRYKSSFFSRPNKIVFDSSWKMVMKIEKYKIYLLHHPEGTKKIPEQIRSNGGKILSQYVFKLTGILKYV